MLGRSGVRLPVGVYAPDAVVGAPGVNVKMYVVYLLAGHNAVGLPEIETLRFKSVAYR